MKNISKKVLTTDLSTFNMTKKTEFNGCFNQGDFEDEDFFGYAEELEMDVDKFKDDYINSCLKN